MVHSLCPTRKSGEKVFIWISLEEIEQNRISPHAEEISLYLSSSKRPVEFQLQMQANEVQAPSSRVNDSRMENINYDVPQIISFDLPGSTTTKLQKPDGCHSSGYQEVILWKQGSYQVRIKGSPVCRAEEHVYCAEDVFCFLFISIKSRETLVPGSCSFCYQLSCVFCVHSKLKTTEKIWNI